MKRSQGELFEMLTSGHSKFKTMIFILAIDYSEKWTIH